MLDNPVTDFGINGTGPVFAGTPLEAWHHRIAMGAGISILGQRQPVL